MITFEPILTNFEVSVFFEAAGAVANIGTSLKPINHMQIKLAQICETLCI